MKLFASKRPSEVKAGNEIRKDQPITDDNVDKIVSYFSQSNCPSQPSTKKKEYILSTEELKKLDSNDSRLNSKQRRLLKRLTAREEQEKGQLSAVAQTDGNSLKLDVEKTPKVRASPLLSGADVSNLPSDHVIETEMKTSRIPSACPIETEKVSTGEVGIKAVNAHSNVQGLTEEELALLDGKNSKEKRKLIRKFQRDRSIRDSLNVNTGNNNSEEKKKVQGNKIMKVKKSKKAMKVDWSNLSLEERERREHQRRMQTLAAEKRARGETFVKSRRAKRRKRKESGL